MRNGPRILAGESSKFNEHLSLPTPSTITDHNHRQASKEMIISARQPPCSSRTRARSPDRDFRTSERSPDPSSAPALFACGTDRSQAMICGDAQSRRPRPQHDCTLQDMDPVQIRVSERTLKIGKQACLSLSRPDESITAAPWFGGNGKSC